jgi:hypothetical protein
MSLKTSGMKLVDIFVKDEGDFSTIIFQSPKSIRLAKENTIGDLYGKEVLKIDIDKSSVSRILVWALTHSLTFESEVAVKIGSKYAITEKEAIKKAIGEGMPDEFYPKILEHVALSTFKGDTLDKVNKAWSVNDKFVVGQRYPVYNNEGYFVVGSDGKGYKMTPAAWSKF